MVSHLLGSYLQAHTYMCEEEEAREKEGILSAHIFTSGLVGLMLVLAASPLFPGASPR